MLWPRADHEDMACGSHDDSLDDSSMPCQRQDQKEYIRSNKISIVSQSQSDSQADQIYCGELEPLFFVYIIVIK